MMSSFHDGWKRRIYSCRFFPLLFFSMSADESTRYNYLPQRFTLGIKPQFSQTVLNFRPLGKA